MPVGKRNKMGVSKETPTKQDHFRGIVKIIASASKGAMQKPWYEDDPYFYMYDLYAGEGEYKGVDGKLIKGSPLVGLEVVKATGLLYKAVFIDKHGDNAKNLARRIGHDPYVKIEHGDNDYVMQRYLIPGKPRHGYVYVDPNDIDIPVGFLNQMFSYNTFQKTDLIINISATAIKRAANSDATSYFGRTLDKVLNEIRNKDRWIIREPHGADQWTFIIGSNWIKFPEWEQKGFVNLTTAKGIEIFEKLVYTKDQLEEMEFERKQSSFDFCTPLTLYPQKANRYG